MVIYRRPADPMGAPGATTDPHELAGPYVVADIGGTNIRFGCVTAPGTRAQAIVAMSCSSLADPESAFIQYLDQFPARRRPRSAVVAVAAPVGADVVRFTNMDWVLDPDRLLQRCGLSCLRLLNDFEAKAMSLPFLADDEFSVIGAASPDRRGTMALIGPGTGLGVSSIVPTQAQGAVPGWQVIPGEGGHVTLGAASDEEAAVLAAARQEFDHVSAERLLSGTGLPALRRAVAAAEGRVAAGAPDARAICDSALRGADPLDVRTLEMFCALLGGVAGNLALTLGARGGVFIGGGIVPRWIEHFRASPFRARFEAKGRFSTYLQPMGTAVITAPYATLIGLAHIHRFPGGTVVSGAAQPASSLADVR
jgi:glucokinase